MRENFYTKASKPMSNGKRRSKKAKLRMLSRLTGGISGCKKSIIKYDNRGQYVLSQEYYQYYLKLGGTMTLSKILKRKMKLN